MANELARRGKPGLARRFTVRESIDEVTTQLVEHGATLRQSAPIGHVGDGDGRVFLWREGDELKLFTPGAWFGIQTRLTLSFEPARDGSIVHVQPSSYRKQVVLSFSVLVVCTIATAAINGPWWSLVMLPFFVVTALHAIRGQRNRPIERFVYECLAPRALPEGDDRFR